MCEAPATRTVAGALDFCINATMYQCYNLAHYLTRTHIVVCWGNILLPCVRLVALRRPPMFQVPRFAVGLILSVGFATTGAVAQEPTVAETATDTPTAEIPRAPTRWEPRVLMPAGQSPDYRRDGRAFRHSLNLWAFPGSSEPIALGTGGRVTLDLLATPHFGFRLGGLGFQSDTTVAALGSAGFILPISTRRFRFKVFTEALFGLQARQTQGFSETFLIRNPDGTETEFRAFKDTTITSYGVIAGTEVKLIIGSGFALNLGAGVLQWLQEPDFDWEEMNFGPRPFVVAGLGWNFRSEPWFMRRHDQRPPQLVLLSPAPEEGEPVRMRSRRVQVNGVAASWRGIAEVWVGDRRAALAGPVPERQPQIPKVEVVGERYRFSTNVDLPAEGIRTLHVVAVDYDGRKSEMRIALASPIDTVGPLIAVNTPGFQQDSLSGVIKVPPEAGAVELEGLLVDQSGVAAAAVDEDPLQLDFPGPEATTLPPDQRRYRFALRVQPEPGMSSITLVARDSLGNEHAQEIKFERPVAELVAEAEEQPETEVTQVALTGTPTAGVGPQIEILEPLEWAGGGQRGLAVSPKTSIHVRGHVRYLEGIRRVFINSRRAALSLDASGVTGVFSGYAWVDARTQEVEVAAQGADGTMSSRVFKVRPTSVPGSAAYETLDEFTGQRWAVVIGVSDYMDPSIPDLEYADDDARAFRDFLLSEKAGLGGFKQENVRFLVDEQATMRNIRSALLTFLKRPTDEDVVVIYLAGHGMPDPERPDNLYLLAHDTELEDIAATGIPMEVVNEAIAKTYARNKVLLADACHSAGVGASGARAVNVNQINDAFLDALNSSTGGFVAFTASEMNQRSEEGEQWCGGHGAFTCRLLEGLNGAADEDGDRIITLGEIMEYTRDRVRRDTRNAQIPTISLTTYDRFWPMAIRLEDDTGSR